MSGAGRGGRGGLPRRRGSFWGGRHGHELDLVMMSQIHTYVKVDHITHCILIINIYKHLFMKLFINNFAEFPRCMIIL